MVQVGASGICRSDWHAWPGTTRTSSCRTSPATSWPGTVAAVGAGVRDWAVGDRVTVPFVCACGTCAAVPGGTTRSARGRPSPASPHWGSLAEYVALDAADVNLVACPTS